MKYRAKPIVVEAFQMTEEHRHDDSGWPPWLNDAWSCGPEGGLWAHAMGPNDDNLMLTTPKGCRRVRFGDWIIRGPSGELSVCDDKVFHETYELVDGEDGV